MNGLVTAWLAEVVLITYRATRKGANQGTIGVPGLPLPSEYASSFLVFGVLGLLPKSAANVASLFGWGIVLATFLNLWPTSDAGATDISGGTIAKGSLTTSGAQNLPSRYAQFPGGQGPPAPK